MEYFIFGLIGIISLIPVIHFVNKRMWKITVKEIRTGWGTPKKEQFDFDCILRHAHTMEESSMELVTTKWEWKCAS